MNSIDKNDVDISSLFNWGTEFTLDTPSGEITFYLKIIGDAEINRARTFALRESAKLRAKLKEEGSEERLAFIPDTTTVERENLIELIVALMMKDLIPKIRRDIDIPYPKEPRTDADLEEFEEYQEEIDNYPELVEKSVEKQFRDGIDVERKKLEKFDTEKLLQIYEKEMINRVCETEMYNKFQDMCVYFSVYRDPDYKDRMFPSFEQYDNLPTQLKEKLSTKYAGMDLKLDDLKK